MSLQVPPIARIGDPIDQVATPALMLELDAFEANLGTMAAFARQHHVALRPHAKAHKSVTIAHTQLAHGAIGICCQKLSEAYPFAAAGIRNIFISNEFVGADKIAMAIELASHTELSVCVDHASQVLALGTAAQHAGVSIAVLPEVDVGQGRCGVTSSDTLLALIDEIARFDSLRFAGIQAYHGAMQHVASRPERQSLARQTADRTASFVTALDARGISCSIITGGGTGSVEFDATSGVYTEIQPGSYAFMDRHYGSLEWTDNLRMQNSLFIASTIMSTARSGRAVCDVGLKAVAVDSGMPVMHVSQDEPPLRYLAANDEHGILEIVDGNLHNWLGEKILLVPGHCDPTFNLYRQIVGFRNGIVECVWDIEASGLIR